MDEQCSLCKFFDVEPDNAMPDKVSGLCRRNPPSRSDRWPSVLPTDWCGEFKHDAAVKIHGEVTLMELTDRGKVPFKYEEGDL